MPNSILPQLFFSDRAKSVLRGALFVYLGLVLCPIQYFAIKSRYVDDTWQFALNYAAAHHLAFGRDILWTSGPLGYLAAPMDIGNNLAQGLAFQAALWVLLLTILWDLFFRGRFPLRNLVFFSICLGLSGFMYTHSAVNPLGAGELLFVGALILLVHFWLSGGSGRYVTALVMLGLVPLIKFVGVMLGATVVAGLIVDLIMQGRSSARREALLAAALPGLVAGAGLWLTLGSFHNLALYLKGSLELSRSYSLAVALWGPRIKLLAGFEALVLLAAALVLLAIRDRRMARFFILLLAVPVLVNFKHAFIRPDEHIVYAFCFVAVALGLVALATVLDRERAITAWAVLVLLLAVLCQDYVARSWQVPAVTGVKVPSLLWHALRFDRLRQMLNAETQQSFSSDQLRVEPEIKAIIQQEPVASLSMSYSGVFVDGLNLQLYPVIQRYSAYNPYLDQLNADWIRDRGPRFLIFDGKSIDSRHPWTETPAMWVEVYRWYDTRMLGARNLLLERRSQPRFQGFELLAHSQLRFGDELLIPASPQPVFWTMQCSLTMAGRLRALLFRVIDVTMTVDERGRQWDPFRVLPEVLAAPSLGNHLPSDLSEFAQVFSPTGTPNFQVEKLSFGGPGKGAYAPVCEVEFLRPAR
jgi:hypothetical protein